MSSFNMPALGGQNQDIKKVYSYIQMLNRQLRYSLSNITPEDNFTQESFLKYQETDTAIAQMEITMNGFLTQFKDLENELETSIKVLNGQIALKVAAGDLCSEISATTDTITFKSGYLVIDSKNFKLYDQWRIHQHQRQFHRDQQRSRYDQGYHLFGSDQRQWPAVFQLYAYRRERERGRNPDMPVSECNI